MEYEYSIACLMCGCVKSQGGLVSPASLTNDQVASTAEHNPGCALANLPSLNLAITSHPDINNANVTRYTIAHS